jgi:hypothetical protein
MNSRVRWERSNGGALFLRREKRTLGIVIENADGTFSWLSRARHQNEPLRYATEDDACNALWGVLWPGLAA